MKRKSIVIRANRHTITGTEFQECDGMFINVFSIEFDNYDYVRRKNVIEGVNLFFDRGK